MVIVGCGGHAKEVLSDGVLLETYNSIYFFDSVNALNRTEFTHKFDIIQSFEDLSSYNIVERKFILAVGNPNVRKKLFFKFIELGFEPISYFSKNALISSKAVIGDCINIMPFASIFDHAKVGIGSLVNSYVSIHHDASVGEFCELSPGARILGHAIVGNNISIGANATILPGIKVGCNSIIGAGAVVTKNVPANCVAVGVPAKIIKGR